MTCDPVCKHVEHVSSFSSPKMTCRSFAFPDGSQSNGKLLSANIRSDSGARSSCSSSPSAPRTLMPPRTVRTSALPVGSGEKIPSSYTCRNPPNPGRTSASKDFILPKYANNRIPAKPGVRSSSLPAAEQDAGEERKVPSSNLQPPSRLIEGRIAKPSNLKSDVMCRSAGQRTSGTRRPQSLLVYSSASSASCDHLTASSSSLSSPASRIRKRGIPAYSTLAKEASVTSSIRYASRERKIGSITSPAQRQESAIIRQNERRADPQEHVRASGARKPPQSVAKVTPFPLTVKRNCDAPDPSSTKEIRTNDGKESSDQQPLSNNDASAGERKKGADGKESSVTPESETDVKRCTRSPQLLPESDRRAEDAECHKDAPSMQSLSLMIASYKVKSRKLSERLDQENSRRQPERRHRQEQKFDDSYSDTECSRRMRHPECDHRNQENGRQTSALIPTISGVSNRFACLPKSGAVCQSRREADRKAHVNNQTAGYCPTVSDAG